MRLNEYTDIFGKWKAVTKSTNVDGKAEWNTLEEFSFRASDAVDLKKEQLAKRYGLSPDEIVIYNMEDEPELDMEEGVMHKINGGKRRIRRNVNVSQREHDEKITFKKR